MSQMMSQRSEAEEAKPVLTASVHDVRYFVALLRGINIANRASVTLTREGGMTVTVEEGRTLLATSYIYPDHFDSWEYNLEPTRVLSSQQSSLSKDSEPDSDSTSFEIPLGTLIECLNIFGTATFSSATAGSKSKKWRRGEHDDASDDDAGGRQRSRAPSNAPNNSRIEQYFGGGGHGKRTSMRLSYGGPGYPLTLLLAEDSTGPTTTCEISTFDPEPNIELPFDGDRTVLKIIFKSSSWLREALSELDPSCDKITFVSNPADEARRAQRAAPAKPLFRIQASGSFGSTEMDYPNDREVLETFECTHAISVSYRFGHISKTLRALQSSTKTSLRIEEEGLLSLQFLVPVPKPRGGMSDSFIEFRCLALDEGGD
ncbi:Rad1-domain-containing protein [Leucogyrophana mollusca]|uniref:Rad1-domain-containing protein n=1 Tax=Leucogyrophana mollusca TaxID=85980 RepID=A0ACB8BMB6_9AGAM|nr:Rad1-domain-containing protein [Leucogyrophana mollusca]